MNTPLLFAIAYSPWSEKARWALDHHRIGYTERAYTPMLSEPALRWRLRRARGPVSVPVLFADREAYTDSFDIAQFAERRGAGAPLFRRGLEEEIAHWNQVSDRAMAAGRALVAIHVAGDPQARSEALPDIVPRPLRRTLEPAARLGVRFLRKKYGFGDDEGGYRAELRQALLEIRAALADGRSHLLGDFSYADIAAAAALQFVQPVADQYRPLGPGTRRAWTDLELAGELTDLVEWRDQLYAQRRQAAARAA
jgi:glutathione S-transferase